MALSDHWRCVSTPRWVRTSEKVTSTCQRRTKIAMISAGASAVSVLKKACGARLPAGSRTSTHRIGRGGVPRRYHRAVPLVISRGLSVCLPYQIGTVMRCQRVAGSVSRAANLGRGAPFCAGRPWVRAVRSAGGA